MNIRKFLTSEYFLFVFFSIITLIAGTFIIPYRSGIAKPGTVYDGTEFYTDDYSVYVSDILQGMNGRWTLLDKHTSEPHTGTIIHDEYLLWGKLMGLFKIDQITAYHLARIFFGTFLLIALYYFLREILSVNLRKLSFFLIIFSGCFPIISKTPEGILIIRNQLEWLSQIDVLQRFTVLPHYLLGNLFFILALIFLIKSVSANNLKNISLFLINGILMSFVLPINTVVFYGMIIIYILFSSAVDLISSKSKSLFLVSLFKKKVIPAVLFFLATIPVLLYYKSQFNIPPWNQFPAWEGTNNFYLPLKDYALAVGPSFFLAPFGLLALLFISNLLPKTKKPKKEVALILLSWILSFFLFVFYSYPFLTISEVRFMQNFFFIPFGILAAFGIYFLSQLLASLFSVLFKIRKLSSLFIGIFIIIILIISLPTYYRSIEFKLTIYSRDLPLVFPEKNWVEAIKWLTLNTRPEELVLAGFYGGHSIPFLSGNTVYMGHMWATLDRQKKEEKLYKFFDGKLSENEAEAFFKETRAVYLFEGYEEKMHSLKPETLPFLKKIFDNNAVQIYKKTLPLQGSTL